MQWCCDHGNEPSHCIKAERLWLVAPLSASQVVLGHSVTLPASKQLVSQLRESWKQPGLINPQTKCSEKETSQFRGHFISSSNVNSKRIFSLPFNQIKADGIFHRVYIAFWFSEQLHLLTGMQVLAVRQYIFFSKYIEKNP